MRFADPKNDLAFKKIFGNEQHKEILISFLKDRNKTFKALKISWKKFCFSFGKSYLRKYEKKYA